MPCSDLQSAERARPSAHLASCTCHAPPRHSLSPTPLLTSPPLTLSGAARGEPHTKPLVRPFGVRSEGPNFQVIYPPSRRSHNHSHKHNQLHTQNALAQTQHIPYLTQSPAFTDRTALHCTALLCSALLHCSLVSLMPTVSHAVSHRDPELCPTSQ
jgi:hypothetical protein